jgi:hypothetical protein
MGPGVKTLELRDAAGGRSSEPERAMTKRSGGVRAGGSHAPGELGGADRAAGGQRDMRVSGACGDAGRPLPGRRLRPDMFHIGLGRDVSPGIRRTFGCSCQDLRQSRGSGAQGAVSRRAEAGVVAIGALRLWRRAEELEWSRGWGWTTPWPSVSLAARSTGLLARGRVGAPRRAPGPLGCDGIQIERRCVCRSVETVWLFSTRCSSGAGIGTQPTAARAADVYRNRYAVFALWMWL